MILLKAYQLLTHISHMMKFTEVRTEFQIKTASFERTKHFYIEPYKARHDQGTILRLVEKFLPKIA